MMRCPVCQAENRDDAVACDACGAPTKQQSTRRVRRDRAESSAIDSPADKHGLAWTAYRCSVVGLIPLAGLVFGPLAVVLGFIAWRRGQEEPLQGAFGPAQAAMLLGGLVALTNWVGLALMIYGLWTEWGS